MTKQELLNEIKTALGNVPSQLDGTITLYMNETIDYMLSAGVPSELLADNNIDPKCVGCIIRGVADLWNYGNGDTKLSEYFCQRVIQLAFEAVNNE